jgi:hypothetical protein
MDKGASVYEKDDVDQVEMKKERITKAEERRRVWER